MKIKVFLIIVIVLIGLLTSTCDSLIEPLSGRNNPNDPDNPVPAPQNFSVDWNTEVRDEYFIELTWSQSNEVEGFYTIKKMKTAPENIFDGEPVAVSNPTETYVSQEIPEDGYGYEVYWAVFSFNPKWSDMSDDDKLFLHDGILDNYNNYNFNGPVTDSATCYAVKRFYPIADGYIGESGGWQTTQDYMWVETIDNSGPDPVLVSCLSFDLSETPPGYIEYAELVLTRQQSWDWEGELRVDLPNNNWEDITALDDIDGPEDVDPNYTKTVDIVNSDDKFYIPVLDIYEAWALSNKDNNGLRLITDSVYGGAPLSIHTLEHIDSMPEFRLYYYQD